MFHNSGNVVQFIFSENKIKYIKEHTEIKDLFLTSFDSCYFKWVERITKTQPFVRCLEMVRVIGHLPKIYWLHMY